MAEDLVYSGEAGDVYAPDDDDHGPGCDGPLNCTCPDDAPVPLGDVAGALTRLHAAQARVDEYPRHLAVRADAIHALQVCGWSLRRIATELGLSVTAVHNATKVKK